MAVDELLLESVIQPSPDAGPVPASGTHPQRRLPDSTPAPQPQCILRIYRWAEPTISLGYFQDVRSLPQELIAAQLPIVRRLSGGGALLHHHELTYSCVLPDVHPLTRTPPEIYTVVHHAVAAVLCESGIPVQMRGVRDAGRRSEFLCFGRGDEHDLVCQGFKVLGSAQRRRKGAILQHGSLILRRSEHAAQFPGVFDLASGPVDEPALVQRLLQDLSRLFAPHSACGPLTGHEQTQAISMSPGYQVLI